MGRFYFHHINGMLDIEYDSSRVTALEEGIPDILRQDYLEIGDDTSEEEIGQRAMNHVDIDSDDWHKTAKKTLTKVLELLELEEGDIIIYPWRGALAMYEATLDMDMSEGIAHIHFGLARDEKNPETTAEKYLPFNEEVLEKIKNAKGKIIIADPMLATGGSIKTIVEEVNPQDLIDESRFNVACLLAAPEGLKMLQEKYPGMHIFTGVVDERLDEKKFIVPGLGDFGDKYIAALMTNPKARQELINSLPMREKQKLNEIFDKLAA